MKLSDDPRACFYARLRDILLRHMTEAGSLSAAVPGLRLHRRDVPRIPEHCFSRPALTLIVQGAKRTLLGGKITAMARDSAWWRALPCPI